MTTQAKKVELTQEQIDNLIKENAKLEKALEEQKAKEQKALLDSFNNDPKANFKSDSIEMKLSLLSILSFMDYVTLDKALKLGNEVSSPSQAKSWIIGNYRTFNMLRETFKIDIREIFASKFQD